MEFDEVVDQVIALLQRQGRVSYRGLARRFALDDAALDVLKDELLFAYPVIDAADRGCVWTGPPTSPESARPRGAAHASRLYAFLPDVLARLQREQRVTYRALTDVFGLDEALLEGRDATNSPSGVWPATRTAKGWSGRERRPLCPTPRQTPHAPTDAPRLPVTAAAPAVPAPAALPLPPHVTASLPPSNGPTVLTPDEAPTAPESGPTPAVDGSVAGAGHEVLSEAPPAARVAPEAERRQLTVRKPNLRGSSDPWSGRMPRQGNIQSASAISGA